MKTWLDNYPIDIEELLKISFDDNDPDFGIDSIPPEVRRISQLKAIDKALEVIEQKLKDPNLAKGTAVSLARVSGYVRIVGNYNRGKREEAIERLTYELANSKSTTQKHGVEESEYRDK